MMLVGSWFQKALYVGITVGVLAACGDDDTTQNPTTTSGTGNTGNTGNTGGMGGATGGGGSGGSAPACTADTAEDLTAMAAVDFTWSNPFSRCVKIAAGTDVTWNGNFSLHPLNGGTTPTVDPNSPITMAMASGMMATINFPDPGTFPFFCGVHTATMTGTLFVE